MREACKFNVRIHKKIWGQVVELLQILDSSYCTMREACKFNVRIHNGNILMSSVTKDPGVSSILLFSGSGINFPRPLYLRECSKKFETVLMGYSGAGGKLIH